MMKHVTIADSVMEEIGELRSAWKYVSVSQLCGHAQEALTLPQEKVSEAPSKKRSISNVNENDDRDFEDDSNQAASKLNAAKLRYLQRKK